MAATLLEALQAQPKQTSNQPPAPPQGQATDLARKLMLSRTGKAQTGGASPALVNQDELQAASSTQAQIGQLGAQGALADAATQQADQGQTAAYQQASQQLGQQRQGNQLQERLQTNQILGELERNKGAINLDRDRAKLDQVAHGMAMQDRKYVSNLESEGRRQRLDSDVEFARQYQRASLGDAQELLRQKLGTDNLIQAKQRDINKMVAEISIDDAIQLAKAEMSRQNIQEKWGGIAEAGKGGLGAYAAYKAPTSEPTLPPSNTAPLPGAGTGNTLPSYGTGAASPGNTNYNASFLPGNQPGASKTSLYRDTYAKDRT